MQTLQKFQAICQTDDILEFSKTIFLESYTDRLPHHTPLIKELLDTIFTTIRESRTNSTHFQTQINWLNQEVFKNQDSSFWFNQAYQEYKTVTKLNHRVSELNPLLQGKRVLDFGCGSGLTGLALSQHGYDVYLADEIDYRHPRTRHLPFCGTAGEGLTSFADSFFDATIIMGVLHHIENEQVKQVLGELRRISKRLIIEEDIYFLPGRLHNFPDQLPHDTQLHRFVNLPSEIQKGYLEFLDYYANIIVQGIWPMNMPFAFKTIDEWLPIFAEQQLQTEKIIAKGFQKLYLHRSAHVWFCLTNA